MTRNESSIQHPGPFIKETVIDPIGITVENTAKFLEVPTLELSQFLNGETRITGDLAHRFEECFGVEAEGVIRMQSRFNIYEWVKRTRRANR